MPYGRKANRNAASGDGLKTLADGDDYASLGICDNANLVETLVKALDSALRN
jgi:hypothetical protein